MKNSVSNATGRYWDALLACVAGCVFIYLFTRVSGIGISPDSVNYESTATHIREGLSFTDFNFVPLADFPLGYPCLLALVSFLTRTSVLHIAPALNAVLFSGLLLSCAVVIRGWRNMPRLFRTGLLSVLACSPFLLEIYSMLWSETLFLFLILLFFISLKKYLAQPSVRKLVVAATICALAFVTRYAGVTVLLTGLALILFSGSLPAGRKIFHLVIFTVTGCSLVAVNLVRNRMVAGHATGVREKALRSLPDNFSQIGGVVADWLPFLHGQERIATALFILLLIVAAVAMVFFILQQQFYAGYQNIVTSFFLVYSVFILTIATVSRFENLTSRLLSPVYIPMIMLITGMVAGFYKRVLRRRRIIPALVAIVLLVGFHLNHYRLNAEAWEGIKDSGMPGYAEGSWRNSPAVAYVRSHAREFRYPVYANANDAVYFLTGIHALAIPHREVEEEKNKFLRQDSFTLIWFDDGDNPDLVSIEYILAHKKLVSVQKLEGGAVYFFEGSVHLPL